MSVAYEVVLDRILAEMEKGNIPWKRPWKTTGATNILGRKYSGINRMMLSLAPDNIFMTFLQAKTAGGTVKKGEHGWPIVFFSMKEKEEDDEEDGKKKFCGFWKRYTVFGLSQTENVTLPKTLDVSTKPTPKNDIYGMMKNRPGLRHGGNRACYSPSTDIVTMPVFTAFPEENQYCATLYHELVHSTGNTKRLNRFSETEKAAAFGGEEYSKEELIAEIGASFLCAETGIDNSSTMNQSVSYLQSWMKALKDDKRMLVSAASQAEKAVKYILAV